ncbi:MAG TPA: ABC transporter permease [Acidimicrobiia bacterium]|nr:ABC transporter permease [Acidimicrobiia bacterium]
MNDETVTTTRPVRVLEPDGRIALGELWSARDLMVLLAWRDLKVRYAQSLLGAGWALGQPLLMMGVFSVFLGVLAKVPAPGGLPYPVFVLSGLVPWVFFANSVTSTGQSVVGSAQLVEKVAFPRLVMPIAAMLAWLPDLGISIALLLGVMAAWGMAPGWGIVALPLFAVLAVCAAVAVGLWVAALNVAYRDVKYAIPFLLQVGMFATPVVYSAELVPDSAQVLYGLNPMAGVVEGFRWALLGTPAPHAGLLAASVAVTGVVMAGGLAYFRRVERWFADVI